MKELHHTHNFDPETGRCSWCHVHVSYPLAEQNCTCRAYERSKAMLLKKRREYTAARRAK